MGKKGNWFSAMKKALHPEEKQNNNQESEGKSKKKWFRKKKRAVDSTPPATETASTSTTLAPSSVVPPSAGTQPTSEPAKLSAVDMEQTQHAYSVALATAKAAEAAVAAAQAAAEVVRLTAAAPRFAGKSKEEIAAIKIQTAFRGYMGRRTLRALRGLMRLKTMMQGHATKRQTANTLKSMQALARVQTQVRERRVKMAEENLARQKLVHQKYEKEQAREMEKLQKNSKENGDGWDSSGKTKEQIDAKMQSRHEAAIRRERTLAYAFTHQQAWRASSMSAHTLFMDVNNPHWGWSWLERWLAARPWENASAPDSNDNSPRIKPSKATIEITKSYARYLQNNTTKKPSPQKPHSSSNARVSTSKPNAAAARKLRSPSPKSSPRKSMWGQDDDAKSALSLHSEQQSRRNSVTGSSTRDDESLASSQTVPSYMAPTESAKARSSRLGVHSERDKSVTPDRSSVSSVKKRGSHSSQPASPAKSRRSTSSMTDANSLPEHT